MSHTNIESLPAEILLKLFQLIAEGNQEEDDGSCLKVMQSIRLVSQRFKELVTPFLVQHATVGMSSGSLRRLENLCNHPDFSKSINSVQIDASYYDTKLARDAKQFARASSSTLFQIFEIAERAAHPSNPDSELVDKKLEKLWQDEKIPSELEKMSKDDFDETSATKYQKILLRLHEEYVKLTEDQEYVRLDNGHVKRICESLKKLQALGSVKITDRFNGEGGKVWDKLFDADYSLEKVEEDDFFDFVLARSGWNGTFVTAYTTSQPTEMLGELLSQLGRSGLRPRSVEIDLNVSANLSCMQVTDTQAQSIRELVSKTSALKFTVHEWARKGSLAENNDRSKEEMMALGSLITPLAGTVALESLTLDFNEYPRFYEHPTVSLSELLPIQTFQWPVLHDLWLGYLPCNLAEFGTLVDKHRNTIASFTGRGLYLRTISPGSTGDWDEVIDILRGLDSLKSLTFEYPKGGRFGTRGDYKSYDKEAVQDYILRKQEKNPLTRA